MTAKDRARKRLQDAIDISDVTWPASTSISTMFIWLEDGRVFEWNETGEYWKQIPNEPDVENVRLEDIIEEGEEKILDEDFGVIGDAC